MPSYTLEIEAFGIYTTNMPSLEIWEDGVLDSTHLVSSAGSTISVTINYGGALPSSLALTFNDAFAAAGRTIEIRSVKINDKYVNVGNYLSTDSLIKGASATVDIASSPYFYDSTEPALSEFTTGATRTFTALNDTLRVHTGTTAEIFDALDGRDIIYTGSGNDKIFGNGGDDMIRSNAGNDLVSGGAGDDRIYGGDGNDTLYGGDGNDRIHGEAGDDIIHGGAGDDKLNGHDGDDIITGGTGADNLNGGAGADYLFGDDGNDQLIGDAGNDTLDGGAGDDLLYGGAGDDQMNGGDDNDIIIGGVGNDVMHGDDGNDTLYGQEDNDTIYGGNGRDGIYGGAGNDTIDGGPGDDTIDGGTGDDTLNGGSGSDSLNGSDGADTLNGGDGDDTIFGDDGSINFESGLLVIEAENYESTIIQGGHEWEIVSDATASNGKTLFVDNNGADDNFVSTDVTAVSPQVNYTVNFATTGTFYIWIRGRSGLSGGAGGNNDSVHLGFDGVQQTNGGGITGFGTNYSWGSNSTTGGRVTVNVTTPGEHTLNLWMREDGVAIDKIIVADTIGYTPTGLGPDQTVRTSISGGIDTIDGGAGNDTIFGDLGADIISGGDDNDIIYGGDDNDTLSGDNGDDIIFGDAGDDVINGGADDDTIYGGAGTDTLIGDSGTDTLVGGDGDDILIGETYAYSHTALLHAFRFEEGSGATSYDELNSGNDITLTGGTSWSGTAGFDGGTALVFDGGAGYAPARAALESMTIGGALTFSMWGKFDNLNVGGEGWQRLFDFGNGEASNNILFGQVDNGTNITFEVYNGASVSGITVSNAIVEGVWAYWTASVAADGTMSIYKDGVLIGSGSGNVPNTVLRTNNYIGDSNWAIDATLTGAISDFTVHTTDLTQTEITDLYFAASQGLFSVSNSAEAVETDILTGGDGNDLLYGNGGDDTLTGGAGNDTLTGGDGTDTAIYSGNWLDYTISLLGGEYTIIDNVGTDGTDSLSSIENFQFADGTRTQANVIFEPGTTPGTAGTITVGTTKITDIGTTYDRDWYGVTLTGGTSYAIWARGTETEAGTNTDPRIHTIYASDGTTVVSTGDDDGGVGVESLLYFTPGSTGTYYIDLGSFDTEVGTIALSVFVGGSTQIGNNTANTLNGSANADYLEARGGNDTLNGNGGSDILEGGTGNDRLNGGAGADVLYGGGGADTFVLAHTDAVDQIVDFSAAGGDVLDISAILTGFTVGVDDIDDFLQFTQINGNTHVAIDANGTTGGSNFTEIAVLLGNTGEVVQTLYDNGDILV